MLNHALLLDAEVESALGKLLGSGDVRCGACHTRRRVWACHPGGTGVA
jgi:hypothetical protein